MKLEALYIKIANILSLLFVLFFCIIDFDPESFSSSKSQLALDMVRYLIPYCIVLFITFRLTKTKSVAFNIPFFFTLVIAHFIQSNHGNIPFFVIYISFTCLSSLYFDYKNLVKYVVVSNVFIFLLISVFKLQLLGPNIPKSMITQSWFFTFIAISFILIISKYASSKQLQSVKAKDSFNTMLGCTPNLMALVDDRNCITYISNSLIQFSSFESPLHAKGRPILDLFYLPEMKIMISETLDSDSYYEQTKEILIDNQRYWFKLISNKMNLQTTGRFIEIYDVTPLMQAKIDAENATKAKNDFLAKMSHEIRTPMNAVLGMSELLLREPITPIIQEYTLDIRQASKNLISIINDILDFSKIESGKLEIVESEYSFPSMLNDIINIIRVKLSEKYILFTANFDANIPNHLIGDEIRIRQIILNLLSNSCKYTNEGTISFSIEQKQVSEDETVLEISISDTGIGIEEEALPTLFHDFIQIDMKKNKGIEGTGLGLSITKSLCIAMNGDITVKSTYGQGSTFTVTIPQKFSNKTKLATVTNKDLRVLLCKSRTTYVHSIKQTFENLNVNYQLADSQEKLFECLNQSSFDFLFISSSIYQTAKSMIENLNLSTKIVLLTEFGEQHSSENIKTITMPAHAISIANVLNSDADCTTDIISTETRVRFTAPEARILIVDDIRTNLKVAEGLMSSYNMQIDTCVSGAEAIQLVLLHPYDLVFMDHMMPNMDGIETTQKIRALEDGSQYYLKLPIIALTANAIQGMKEMYLENGFHDFLAKPVEISKLNAILEKWIPRNKKQKNTTSTKVNPKADLRIEGVDVALGIRMTGGTLFGYLNTLSTYHQDGLLKIEQIGDAYKHKKIHLYTTYVHALKSASASIGAMSISNTAQLLELAGKAEDLIFIDENTEGFLCDLKELLHKINSVLSSIPSTPKANKTIERPVLTENLKKLSFAIENFDTNESDEIFAFLFKSQLDEKMKCVLEEISSHILLCDYEKAKEQIDLLLTTV